MKILIFYSKESLKQKNKKRGFLSILLGTLGASLLGNLLTGKGILRYRSGNKKGIGILRAAYWKNKGCHIYKNFDEYADVGTYWIALFCKKKWNCLFL